MIVETPLTRCAEQIYVPEKGNPHNEQCKRYALEGSKWCKLHASKHSLDRKLDQKKVSGFIRYVPPAQLSADSTREQADKDLLE